MPATTESSQHNPIDTTTTNTYALIGFVLSLSSFIVFITAIPGVILGHMGLSQIKKTNEGGRGLGIAALVIGYIQIGLVALVALIGMVFLILFVLAAIAAAINRNGGFVVS